MIILEYLWPIGEYIREHIILFRRICPLSSKSIRIRPRMRYGVFCGFLINPVPETNHLSQCIHNTIPFRKHLVNINLLRHAMSNVFWNEYVIWFAGVSVTYCLRLASPAWSIFQKPCQIHCQHEQNHVTLLKFLNTLIFFLAYRL